MTKKFIAGIALGIIGVGALALLVARTRENIFDEFDEDDCRDACHRCEVQGCMRRRGKVATACMHHVAPCGDEVAMEKEGEVMSGCGGCRHCHSSCPNHKGTFPDTGEDANWTDIADAETDVEAQIPDVEDSEDVFESDDSGRASDEMDDADNMRVTKAVAGKGQ